MYSQQQTSRMQQDIKHFKKL